jgi:mono/diheme cytochrome c family protein
MTDRSTAGPVRRTADALAAFSGVLAPLAGARALLAGALALLATTLAAQQGDTLAPGSPAVPAVPEDAAIAALHDPGREVFLKTCATCHGETGDGVGVTKLDRPARSFKDGGFSFGDTPEALFRTITSGIAGSPMPAFGEALSEEERRAVADYVRSLGPPRVQVSDSETLMVVTDTPRIARGILAPIVDGAPLVPRGLLVGETDGLTFQYDAERVRLLGVRMGPFVRRTDWTGRGGTPLEALGRVVWTDAGGDPPQRWLRPADEGAGAPVPCVARLRGTTGGRLWYQLSPGGSSAGPLLSVFESGRAAAVEGAVGFVRHLALYGAVGRPEAVAILQLDDLPPSARAAHIAPGGRPEPAGSGARVDLAPGDTHWWVASQPDGSAVLAGIGVPLAGLDVPLAGAVAVEVAPEGLRVHVRVAGRPASAALQVYTLLAPAWDDALAARLATGRPSAGRPR